MAGAERGIVYSESKSKLKDRALWFAEKSTIITAPLIILAWVSGGISASVATKALILDIGGSLGARWIRNRSNNKNG